MQRALHPIRLHQADPGRGLLVTDEANVYWAADSGLILRVPKAGGPTSVLVEEFDAFDGVARLDRQLYWSVDCRLRRREVDDQGTRATTLMGKQQGGWCPTQFALD